MPFNRPSLATLIDRIQADLESRIPGADARLRRNVLNAIAAVHAAAVHNIYAYLDFIAKQPFPDTADQEHLERIASLYGLARLPASFAIGDVTFTGTNGSAIPSGTELQTSSGARYVTTDDGAIAGGTADVPVTAVDAGSTGNLIAGTAISLLESVLGVNAQAVVAAAGITGGADVESDDQLRTRVIERLQSPPQGGAKHDYVGWAKAAHPSVTRVWVFPQELGAGTVVVRIVTDNEASLTATQPVIDAVQSYIDDIRPLNATVTVDSPVETAVDFDIAVEPNTAEVQAAVTAELEDLFRRVAAPQGIIPLSQIREAISVAAGETDHVLNSPISNVQLGANEIPVLGAITWS